ncbi:hypothetical protein U1701_02205 [Sphingomonas sp. PB2P19]|uniref:hypothetical protein n=1 Tax=Sphingomonas rhamnosi TaxID=3096156 RepID=UPI002FC990EF
MSIRLIYRYEVQRSKGGGHMPSAATTLRPRTAAGEPGQNLRLGQDPSDCLKAFFTAQAIRQVNQE